MEGLAKFVSTSFDGQKSSDKPSVLVAAFPQLDSPDTERPDTPIDVVDTAEDLSRHSPPHFSDGPTDTIVDRIAHKLPLDVPPHSSSLTMPDRTNSPEEQENASVSSGEGIYSPYNPAFWATFY